MKFDLIRNIDVDNPDTWKDKVFLTVDVEWVNDDVFGYLLDIFFKHDVRATLFCTHETKWIDQLKKNENFELGIHPNFEFLLQGDFRYGDTIDKVIKTYKEIVPDAISARSHCLTTGTTLSKFFFQNGLRFDCNPIIPYSSGMELMPWYDWNEGLIKVPMFWEDDVHCIYKWENNIAKYLDKKGLKVFNFHPVMTLINMTDIEHYIESKNHYNDYNSLLQMRSREKGTGTMLDDLITLIKSQEG